MDMSEMILGSEIILGSGKVVMYAIVIQEHDVGALSVKKYLGCLRCPEINEEEFGNQGAGIYVAFE